MRSLQLPRMVVYADLHSTHDSKPKAKKKKTQVPGGKKSNLDIIYDQMNSSVAVSRGNITPHLITKPLKQLHKNSP